MRGTGEIPRIGINWHVLTNLKESLTFTSRQVTQQEPENTKEVVYNFMEEELKISNPRDSIAFQRILRVGKPKHDDPRPLIARFLRCADREMVLHQARKTLKNKDFSVFEDIPKELYRLRKSQSKMFTEAKDRGDNVYFSKKFPDRLMSMDSLFRITRRCKH